MQDTYCRVKNTFALKLYFPMAYLKKLSTYRVLVDYYLNDGSISDKVASNNAQIFKYLRLY